MKMNTQPKAALVSLGCPKNLVDSEVILGALREEGFSITFDDQEADILVINTCSFIDEAKDESLEVIFESIERKKQGQPRFLVVAGCLAQLYGEKLLQQIPEIDLVIGTGLIDQAGRLCRQAMSGEITNSVHLNEPSFLYTDTTPRLQATLPHVAYVKIADGCNNRCSYCLIPTLRGKYRSRPAASVVTECTNLARQGVREINLIAQDSTAYGQDRPTSSDTLVPLLKELVKIEDLAWIRLLYLYPDSLTPQLLECLAEEPKLCKYIDLPIQHINDRLLKAMNRRSSRQTIEKTISLIRNLLPQAILRTSLIVAFPGEGQREFQELLSFVAEAEFDRLGVFCFSPQEGTPAARLKGRVPDKIALARKEKILQIQARISLEKNQRLIGSRQEVIIDSLQPEPTTQQQDTCCLEHEQIQVKAIARMQGHAPEIDGLVYLLGNGPWQAGSIQTVTITGAEAYDLLADCRRNNQCSTYM